jgi:hypothetical protein
LNRHIRVEISRLLKYKKPALIKDREYATKVTKSSANVDISQGKAKDHELIDLRRSKVEQSC